MINNLYVSYQSYDWSKDETSDLVFLRHNNLEKIIYCADNIDCYTTLEDLQIKFNEIENFIDNCKKIILVGFDKNPLQSINPTNLHLYCVFLNLLNKQKKVTGQYIDILSLDAVNKKQDSKKTDGQALWVGGCSFSFGTGIDPEQRYGTLLSKKLKLPLIMLAKPGSSILWQADQWLRADIQPGDIAVWGLPNICRQDIFNIETNSWESVTIRYYLDLPKKYQYWNIDYFDSFTQSVYCIKNILQVENYFRKIGIEFYFVNFMDMSYLPLFFRKHKSFLDLTTSFNSESRLQFLDYGSDDEHPGVNQHEKYFLDIYDFIQQSRNSLR
jgi:hypothetical protein